MFAPRGNYKGRRGGNSGRSPAPRGLFVNGIWHCDCEPRQPATHFETKKPGPNKGRWFRSCQKQDGERCGFFLWDSDAQPRELAALSNNSRSEPGHTTLETLAKRRASPPLPCSIEKDRSGPSRKRSRVTSDSLDDDFGLGQADDDFDQELTHVMAEIETPSKAARTSSLATPATTRRKLPWQIDQPTPRNPNGLQTPQTGHKASDHPFASGQPAQRSSLFTSTKLGADDSHETSTPVSSQETPTPLRTKDAESDTLVQDVLILLQEDHVYLSTTTQSHLRVVLAKHAKNTEGYRRGRDVLRATVKARDAKITELNYRIRTLEAELEAEKVAVSHLQWEAQDEVPDT